MTTQTALLHKIQENCLNCCGGSYLEVEKCTLGDKCALFPYRFGRDPEGASEAKQAQGKKLQERKKLLKVEC